MNCFNKREALDVILRILIVEKGFVEKPYGEQIISIF